MPARARCPETPRRPVAVMRGSLALACALLACRPRAGSRDERWDAGSTLADAPRVDVTDAAPPTPTEAPAECVVEATDGEQLQLIAPSCVYSAQARERVSLGPGWGVALLELDRPVVATWQIPAAPVIRARGEGTRLRCPREPGVTVVLGRGELDVDLPAGSVMPARIDTPAGRLIVTRGRASLRVPVTEGGRLAEVQVRTLGASARFWHIRQGVARVDELAPRGAARWRPEATQGQAWLDTALREARRALDEAPSDAARARASLWLGTAEAAMTALNEIHGGSCDAHTRTLTELTVRLLAPLPR